VFEHPANESLIWHPFSRGRGLDGIEEFLGQAHVDPLRLRGELKLDRLELREIEARQVLIEESFGFFVCAELRSFNGHRLRLPRDASRAFSDEVDPGSSKKMRQNKNLESFAIAMRS
jgi:hypothetical protein